MMALMVVAAVAAVVAAPLVLCFLLLRLNAERQPWLLQLEMKRASRTTEPPHQALEKVAVEVVVMNEEE